MQLTDVDEVDPGVKRVGVLAARLGCSTIRTDVVLRGDRQLDEVAGPHRAERFGHDDANLSVGIQSGRLSSRVASHGIASHGSRDRQIASPESAQRSGSTGRMHSGTSKSVSRTLRGRKAQKHRRNRQYRRRIIVTAPCCLMSLRARSGQLNGRYLCARTCSSHDFGRAAALGGTAVARSWSDKFRTDLVARGPTPRTNLTPLSFCTPVTDRATTIVEKREGRASQCSSD